MRVVVSASAQKTADLKSIKRDLKESVGSSKPRQSDEISVVV